MDLAEPAVNIADRIGPGRLGAFVSQAGTAQLPPCQLNDVATSFGSVRTYRFDGAGADTPIVLLPDRLSRFR
ncbi:hypothetical protein [Mycolicibacterium bacteremicum]|uniref:hypothetical protein n=1 Tax=Mycolicibacterium bacteremicum TaxID=564198 RepID=UPI0026EBCEE7|nr:hypothetical protein [Mycolicibacterium bacteremicum]